MTAWTRPTILRPDLCRWVQYGDHWEFGPTGCELVYTLDDSIVLDPQARDASMRLVESHIAVHPLEDRRIWLGMRDGDEWLPHPEAQSVAPSHRWETTVHSSTFCKHHGGVDPVRKVHNETWLIHNAADTIAEHLPIGPDVIARSARYDAKRNLHIVGLEVEPIVKSRLESVIAERLGHRRVLIP